MIVKDLLSIIIPAYDAAGFIRQAIESVLAQAHDPIEIIVVDDGSADDTAQIAEGFGSPVRCHRQENAGAPAARNCGLGLASGEYIGFLDADDLFEPGSIAVQLAKLRENPSIDIVIGRLVREELASRPGEPMIFKPFETPAEAPNGKQAETEDQINLQLGACLMRRNVVERVGLLDSRLRHSDDWDWFMRARELEVPMLLHQAIVLRQRLHHNNMTRDRAASLQYLSLMLKRSLDRRRAGSGQARILPDLASYRENTQCKGDGEP